MARLFYGIGDEGSSKEIFFHPSQLISEKWLNEHRTNRVLEVLLVGKGTHHVNRKDQLCYKCRIPKFTTAPYSTFAVATSRLNKPLQPPLNMKSLWGQLWLLHKTRSAIEPQRYAGRSQMLLRMLTEDYRKKFAELRQKGIEAEDENEPAPR